ncbi:MAG: hypothetical protein K2H41_04930 [Acetatifactor sp.]|nr:hypothetical protein [Acetatifactor sp.]
MHEKLKTSFDHIHAEPDLKAGTREFLLHKMSEYPKKSAAYRSLLAAAICLVFMLAGFGGYRMYFTPVSAVSIDINPSIEFKINRFDKVLSVEGYNDDGIDLASGLNVRFMGYMDAINQVLNDRTVMEYLAQDEVLSIMVSSADGKKQNEMLANVECYAAEYHNVYCGMGRYEDMTAAHMHGLSFGKYRAFLELQALEPNITPEDVQGWTMREIRDRIDALSGTVPDNGQGGAGHHGQGGEYGHRNGWSTQSE